MNGYATAAPRGGIPRIAWIAIVVILVALAAQAASGLLSLTVPGGLELPRQSGFYQAGQDLIAWTATTDGCRYNAVLDGKVFGPKDAYEGPCGPETLRKFFKFLQEMGAKYKLSKFHSLLKLAWTPIK